MRTHRLSLLAFLAACSPAPEAPPPVAPPPPSAAPAPPPAPPVHVRILGFNDFHGNLRPPSDGLRTVPGEVGGAAWFAAHMKRLGAGKPDTIVVAAGDSIGASPLSSALFHDEPTVAFLNEIGLSVTSLGNHEFDEGQDEIFRMKKGGCHPKDGCKFEPTFGGSKFDTLGANVFYTKDHTPFLPGWVQREVNGIPIAFVGMVLTKVPSEVLPQSVIGLSFEDEAKSANALVPEIRAKGIETMILLIHNGGDVKGGGLDDCNSFHGPIIKIVENLDPAFDAVISGHTHDLYNCVVAKRPVTSALSYGRAITALDLSIDPRTKDVVATEAHNHAVTHDLAPDPVVKDIVDRAAKLAGPMEDRVVGTITETLSIKRPDGISSGLGSVIADAELAATRKAGAKIALVNSSGVRMDIAFGKTQGENVDGQVRFGEIFAVQPFGNHLVTLTVTGAELRIMLERYTNARDPMEVSESLSVDFTLVNGKKKLGDIRIDGVKVEPTTKVRLTTNSYLSSHDSELKNATDVIVGGDDVEAIAAYFKAHPKLSQPKKPRFVAK